MQVKITVKDCQCPNCNALETHPADAGKPILEQRLLIRAFKVFHTNHWWSQCLVCAGYYDEITLAETPNQFDANKGWF